MKLKPLLILADINKTIATLLKSVEPLMKHGLKVCFYSSPAMAKKLQKLFIDRRVLYFENQEKKCSQSWES
jgi:hypothetical protein